MGEWVKSPKCRCHLWNAGELEGLLKYKAISNKLSLVCVSMWSLMMMMQQLATLEVVAKKGSAVLHVVVVL